MDSRGQWGWVIEVKAKIGNYVRQVHAPKCSPSLGYVLARVGHSGRVRGNPNPCPSSLRNEYGGVETWLQAPMINNGRSAPQRKQCDRELKTLTWDVQVMLVGEETGLEQTPRRYAAYSRLVECGVS